MISVALNETLQAVCLHLDEKGIDLLIAKLKQLKADGDHLHIYAVDDDTGISTFSPYHEAVIFKEIVLNLLPPNAWEDARFK